jgi:hypothetical protein
MYNSLMTEVQRYDYSELQARIDADGFLYDSPITGRVGIQEYRRADGTVVRELRLPEEVFHPDALASAKGKPITVDHPAGGKVNKSNAHRVTVGTLISEAKQDGDYVRNDLVIHSPDAIGDRRQLSYGYTAKMDETPGEHPLYGRYDSIQRHIRINHLSVVKSARAGGIAKLNLDGNEDFLNPQEHQTMTVKVKLDNGIEYDAAPEVAVELNKLRADASTAAEQLKTIPQLQAKVDALESDAKTVQAKLDAAKAEGRAEAEARTKLEAVAAGFKIDCKDKSDREVKEAVILAVRKDAKLEGKDELYINAAFDMAVEMKGDALMASQRQAVHTKTDNAGTPTSAQKREAMIAGFNKEDK